MGVDLGVMATMRARILTDAFIFTLCVGQVCLHDGQG